MQIFINMLSFMKVVSGSALFYYSMKEENFEAVYYNECSRLISWTTSLSILLFLSFLLDLLYLLKLKEDQIISPELTRI